MANGGQDRQYDSDFFDKITKGKWDDVVRSCRENSSKIGLPLTKTEDNLIHLAVSRGETETLRELLRISRSETMELRKNTEGDTPLNLAARRGDRVMCELLCENGKAALTIRNNSGETPMYLASVMGKMDAFNFLLGKFMVEYSVPVPLVRWDQMSSIQRNRCNDACRQNDMDTILHAAIRGEFIDLAYKIFYHFPHLAIIENNEGETPIHLLAKLPSSFRSGYHPGIVKRLVYHFIPENLAWKERPETRTPNDVPASQTENNTRTPNDVPASQTENDTRTPNDVPPSQIENDTRIQSDGPALNIEIPESSQAAENETIVGFFLPKSVIKEKRKHSLTCTMVNITFQYLKKQQGINPSNPWMRSKNAATNPSEVTVPNTSEGANPLGNTASNSNTSQQAAASNSNTSQQATASNPSEEKKTNIDAPIVSAVKMGITEMVSMILQSFPSTIEDVDGNKKNLVFVAAESRQPQVLQLLLKFNVRQTLVTERLEDGKNVLHVAADLKKDHHPWSIISGAPLQMHLEAKWFELVKSLMPSHLQLYKNSNGEKPNEVFEKSHEKLAGEGIKWLSSTATSCTAISSLLTTAALATAATVPGGVDQHGAPNLRDEWRFKVFSISALMTVCFGVLSLVFFLVILSSRSDVKKFKVGLPRKLIYGLTSLCFSLSTFLLAFCSAQSFAMHGRVRYAAYALYAILTSSIIYLVKEQLPLFVDFIEITSAKLGNWSNS